MRALKVIGLVLAGVALLLAAAAGAVAVGGAPLLAKLIETQGAARLGRGIHLGRIEIDWGAPVRIAAEDVRVANAEWGSSPDMFTARRLEAEIDPRALLRMRLLMPRLELFGPVVLLERSTKDAGGNWGELLAKAATPGRSGAAADLRRLVVHQGRLTYRNGRTRAETDLAVDDLDAEAPDPTRPVAVTAKGRVGTEPFALTAELAPPDELRQGGGPSPMRLDFRLGANTAALSGTATAPWAPQGLDMQADLAGQNLLQPLLAMLGVPVPPVPLYRLAGHVRREGARWNFEDVTAEIGNSHLAAARVLIDAGPPVPYIRADLTAEGLDLTDLKGFFGGEPGPPPPGSGARSNGRLVPDHRLPIETLRAFNADISLDAPRVKPSAGLPFERLNFGMSLRDGTLRVRRARLAVAQGELSADLDYRADDPPVFRADLELRRLDLRTLLGGMDVSTSSKRTAGLLGGFARLHSSGETPRKMLAALEGDIGLFLEGGRLGGPFTDALDVSVAEALGLVAKGDGPRAIQCFLGRFDVKGGIATADTLLLDTATTVVVGVGNVNLGDETLFLDLKPYPKTETGSLGNVRVPVSIRGTFAEPKVAADKTRLAERLGAALGLVRPTLPATLLPLLAAGLGEKTACRKAFDAGRRPAPGAAEGSSTPPAPPRR
jgi:AsmA family protein